MISYCPFLSFPFCCVLLFSVQLRYSLSPSFLFFFYVIFGSFSLLFHPPVLSFLFRFPFVLTFFIFYVLSNCISFVSCYVLCCLCYDLVISVRFLSVPFLSFLSFLLVSFLVCYCSCSCSCSVLSFPVSCFLCVSIVLCILSFVSCLFCVLVLSFLSFSVRLLFSYFLPLAFISLFAFLI